MIWVVCHSVLIKSNRQWLEVGVMASSFPKSLPDSAVNEKEIQNEWNECMCAFSALVFVNKVPLIRNTRVIKWILRGLSVGVE